MKLPNAISISPLRQLLNWIFCPYDFLEDCAKSYGNIFTVRFMGIDHLVMFSDPQAIGEIFAIDSKQFDAGKSNTIIEPLVGTDSLLLLDGDRHKRERKMLMPPFHGEKVKSYGKIICQVTEQVARRWQPHQSFLASKAMEEITLEVILHTVFGLSKGERYQQIIGTSNPVD